MIPNHHFVLMFTMDPSEIDANLCAKKSQVELQVLKTYKNISGIEKMVKSMFGKAEKAPFDRSLYVPPAQVKKMVCSGWKSTSKPLENLKWKNPVFQLQEKQVNVVESIREGIKFEKSVFKQLKVIGQVDEKFIACKLVYKEDTLLVMIDQHAADERIKLERYLKQYETLSDDSKISFKAPIEYLELVKEHQDTLAKFGFNVSITIVSKITFSGIIQTTKPFVSITETLALELLLKCLDHLKKHDDIVTILPPMLDYFKSKACRSAIMFGDALEIEECQELIENLEKCDFPFQCAHGRPSIQPLTKFKV
jgi:DNA mismatch repair ATPase MutL